MDIIDNAMGNTEVMHFFHLQHGLHPYNLVEPALILLLHDKSPCSNIFMLYSCSTIVMLYFSLCRKNISIGQQSMVTKKKIRYDWYLGAASGDIHQ